MRPLDLQNGGNENCRGGGAHCKTCQFMGSCGSLTNCGLDIQHTHSCWIPEFVQYRLDSWGQFTPRRRGWLLSAGLGMSLNERLLAAEDNIQNFVRTVGYRGETIESLLPIPTTKTQEHDAQCECECCKPPQPPAHGDWFFILDFDVTGKKENTIGIAVWNGKENHWDKSKYPNVTPDGVSIIDKGDATFAVSDEWREKFLNEAKDRFDIANRLQQSDIQSIAPVTVTPENSTNRVFIGINKDALGDGNSKYWSTENGADFGVTQTGQLSALTPILSITPSIPTPSDVVFFNNSRQGLVYEVNESAGTFTAIIIFVPSVNDLTGAVRHDIEQALAAQTNMPRARHNIRAIGGFPSTTLSGAVNLNQMDTRGNSGHYRIAGSLTGAPIGLNGVNGTFVLIAQNSQIGDLSPFPGGEPSYQWLWVVNAQGLTERNNEIWWRVTNEPNSWRRFGGGCECNLETEWAELDLMTSGFHPMSGNLQWRISNARNLEITGSVSFFINTFDFQAEVSRLNNVNLGGMSIAGGSITAPVIGGSNTGMFMATATVTKDDLFISPVTPLVATNETIQVAISISIPLRQS